MQARAPSTQLPFDIWPQVLGHLSGRARIRVRQVCTIFSQFHPGEQVIVASRLATPNASPSLLRFLTMLSQQRGIKLRLYLDMGSRRYNLRGAPPAGRRNDPHLWSVINAGVQSAGLTSLSLCLHLSLAEGRLILSALPTSLRKLVLEADAQIVTEERWQRLESLVSVELTLPYMGGQPSMPVVESDGLPVVFEGQTQEQVDRFNADISLQSCGAANAVVRCSDHASCIMHDDYLQDALQPDVLRLFLLPDVGCVIIG
ncbi:hypothetical protein WJX84_004224 [Apatococcus fuscideae]|uniref:F-box domain-containing protein n=1 Tax=Apatococcus fuscideae TaxID=2026836 RepID=A0AAW1SV49_9CHLO